MAQTFRFTHCRHFPIACALALLLAGLAVTPVRGDTPTYSLVVQNINYYPIYSANGDTGHYSGYVRDLLDAFAVAEGIQFNYRLRPIRRMMLEYLEGQYDFAVPDNPNWNLPLKRGRLIYYSEPLLEFADAVFVRAKDRDMTSAEMDSYGTIAGFTPWKFREPIARGELKLETAPNPTSLIRMLLSGRVDTINLAMPVARFHFQALDVGNRLVAAPQLLPIETSRYYLSSLKHPEVIARFNAFLEREQALVSELKARYRLEPGLQPVMTTVPPGP